MARKKEINGKEYVMTDFLVVESADNADTWFLPIKTDGELDEALLRQAWKDLHDGTYEALGGPNPEGAILRLEQIFEREGMATPKKPKKKTAKEKEAIAEGKSLADLDLTEKAQAIAMSYYNSVREEGSGISVQLDLAEGDLMVQKVMPDTILVRDNYKGGMFKIPYEIKGEAITFGAPQQVEARLVFEEVPDGKSFGGPLDPGVPYLVGENKGAGVITNSVSFGAFADSTVITGPVDYTSSGTSDWVVVPAREPFTIKGWGSADSVSNPPNLAVDENKEEEPQLLKSVRQLVSDEVLEGLEPTLELKSVAQTEDAWVVGNLMIRYGNRDEVDLEGITTRRINQDGSVGEYFAKGVKWESEYTAKGFLDMDFEHGMDPDPDSPGRGDILGYVDVKSVVETDMGLWALRVLNRQNKYVAALKTLSDNGLIKLGTSTEPIQGKTAKSEDGGIEVWPLFRDSLTVTPMEPRQIMSGEHLVEVKSALNILGDLFPELEVAKANIELGDDEVEANVEADESAGADSETQVEIDSLLGELEVIELRIESHNIQNILLEEGNNE